MNSAWTKARLAGLGLIRTASGGFGIHASGLLVFLLLLGGGTFRSFAASDVEASFESANKLYAQSKFADAALAYEKIAADRTVSPALYFNLGNAYFKSGQIGRAILAYRRAEEFAPRDPDVRANVQFARNLVQGPKIGLAVWRQKLGALSANEWMALCTAAIWVTAGLFIVRFLKPTLSATLRPWTLAAIVTSLLIFGAARLVFAQGASARTAIVVVTDATVRNGPFDESPAAFTAHDGAELRVLDQKDNWLQVTDGKRSTGWVQTGAVEVAAD